jgi:hypothetical protein
MGQGISKGALLLGGLGFGAGLMYLLDPDRGRQRRARGWNRAMLYRDLADEALESASHDLNHRARGLSHDLGRRTQRLGQQAHGLMTEARQRLSRASAPIKTFRARPHQRDASLALLILSGLALGAGLMYLFDPLVGNQRRQIGRNKARSYWQKTGKALDTTRRALGERAHELGSEGKGGVQGDQEQPGTSTTQA